MITQLDEQINLELEKEAFVYILAHPGQKYDEVLLRRLFPKAEVMDNFGIKSEDVEARIEELSE